MIVNADDFGESAARNRAIVAALERGLVTSTSAMANMPGFEQACALAREREAVTGVHLVLTEGEPLTEPIRRCGRFCDTEGRFRKWRGAERAFFLGGDERDAAARELRAQIERCRERGLAVAHVDSHHHVHTERAIAPIVLALAREHGIPRVRLARNCGPGIGAVHRFYKAWLNRRIRSAGLAGTRWFGDVEDYLWLERSGAGDLDSFELMTHPAFRADGVLVDEEHPEHPLVALSHAPASLAPVASAPVSDTRRS